MFSRARNSWFSWHLPQVAGRFDGCTIDSELVWLRMWWLPWQSWQVGTDSETPTMPRPCWT